MMDLNYLCERLAYNPETGGFVWLIGRRAGLIAGCKTKDGYCYIRIDRKNYYAHRLAWLAHFGEWPSMQIDHKDGNRCNNSIANLRLATAAENAQNRVVYRNNKAGLMGVVTYKGRYIARIKAGGPQITLGYFNDPHDAHKAYLEAKTKSHAFQPIVRQA